MSQFIDDEATTSSESNNDFSERRNTFSEHILGSCNLVMVTMFLDNQNWESISTELSKRNILKRSGEDIPLPRKKKQRSEVSVTLGQPSNNRKVSKDQVVNQIKELLEGSTPVPGTMSIDIPDVLVNRANELTVFLDQMMQLKNSVKTVSSFLSRIDELEVAMIYWYYRVQGLEYVKTHIKTGSKLKQTGATVNMFAKSLKKFNVTGRHIKAGLTTMMLNDLVRLPEEQTKLLLYTQANIKTLESCATDIINALKGLEGESFTIKYKEEVENYGKYSDVKKATKAFREKLSPPASQDTEREERQPSEETQDSEETEL